MFEFKSRHRRCFWEILLKNEFNSEALAVLAAHLCWKNLGFSRKFGKLLIKQYNKVMLRELMPCLVSLGYYLTIEDEF